jgi:phosphohistidine swiveling domain-containing protein
MIMQMSHEYEGWWRARTQPVVLTDAIGAQARLREAVDRFRRAMWIQLRVTYLAQGTHDNLATLCRRAGKPGLENELVSGYGNVVEGRIVEDLHALSRAQLEMSEFQTRWGFHGPREGELMSRSWREDVTALTRAVAGYGAKQAQDPRESSRERTQAREMAERELLASLGPAQRLGARALLHLVRTYVPLREVGKAMYVQAIDAGRAAARTLGSDWHARGELADPQDIFFLTIEEITRGTPPDLREIVTTRRARHVEYEMLDLPRSWTGMPAPLSSAAVGSDETTITGVAVSRPETVEGTARVITDPNADDQLEPGEVLVCDTTDPSWVSLFVTAAALVIDIGGPLSHGAIVARELGIPAVVNTGHGTRTIRSGDRLRVDGDTGTVTILERLTRSATEA